jgi:DNA-binding IclR family transcriptional regulator
MEQYSNSGSFGSQIRARAEAAMQALSTVEKAVDVLFHLHAEPRSCGVTAIGRRLGLSKSSTHRLLCALSRRGLVEKDDRGRYRPGIGLVALGVGALDREPIVAAARPVLESEARALGETVFLVAARAGRIIVLDKSEGEGFLRAAPRVGSEVPVHATAVGKLYLAFGNGSVEVPSGRLARFSDETITDRVALDAAAARATERGFAENSDEWIPGLSVVAAPVLATSPVVAAASAARMLAALAVAAPTPRMRSLGCDEMGRRMLAAAARVAARFEGS